MNSVLVIRLIQKSGWKHGKAALLNQVLDRSMDKNECEPGAFSFRFQFVPLLTHTYR